MVKVLFGDKLPDTIPDVDAYFNNTYEYDWFEDEIVKQMVRDIDKSELHGAMVDSPFLGSISVERLFGGVKTLIILLKDDELEFNIDLIWCGENCEKWLAYIFNHKDVTVCMTGVHLRFDGYDFNGICLNDNSQIHNNWWQVMVKHLGDYKRYEDRVI